MRAFTHTHTHRHTHTQTHTHVRARIHTHTNMTLPCACFQDEPFHVQQRTYERQYAQLYYARLSMMREPLTAQVAQRWPGVESEWAWLMRIRHVSMDCNYKK